MKKIFWVLALLVLTGCAATTGKNFSEISLDIKSDESAIFIGGSNRLLPARIRIHVNNEQAGVIAGGEIIRHSAKFGSNEILANAASPNSCITPEKAITLIRPNQKKFFTVEFSLIGYGAICAQYGYKITEVSEEQFLQLFK